MGRSKQDQRRRRGYREYQADGQREIDDARKNAEQRSHEQWQRAVKWAVEKVPEEHPAMAAVAALSIKLGGKMPTPNAVRRRLKATGRDAETLGGKEEPHGPQSSSEQPG